MTQDDNSKGFSISRRRLIGATGALATLPAALRTQRAQAESSASNRGGIKAMTFDIQGTLVDYYQPFARVSASIDARKGQGMNWAGFLADWNAGAASIIKTIITAERPWIPAGQLFREALDTILVARGRTGQLDDGDRKELMSVWGQMAAWSDSAEGLKRLKRKLTVAALSNAGMAAVIAIAKRNGLTFDAILTGELVRAYKPSPEVYKAACTYLGFQPEEIMMVSTHKVDLKAAKAVGFKTAYIPRPLEIGPETKIDSSCETFIDLIAKDLIDLSEKIDVLNR